MVGLSSCRGLRAIGASGIGWLLLSPLFAAIACDTHGLRKSADAGVPVLGNGGTGGVTSASDAAGSGGTTSGLCTASSQCPMPQVCNFNTDMKCGPAIYTQVDVSDEHTCAVVSDGTLRCWGSNSHSQMGTAAGGKQVVPFQVPGFTSVQMVVTGWRYTCVLSWDGQVTCWGYNLNGELGCTTPISPTGAPQCVPFPAGAEVDGIIAGGERACAVMADGTMRCWGRNNHYQVGDGTNVDAFSPRAVQGLADVTAVASGVWQACAVTVDGAAWCWGANNRGQIGNGTLIDSPSLTTPVGLDGVANHVTAVAVGEGNSCFLLDDGLLHCTGDDDYGQLGDGGSTRSKVPVPASQFTPPSKLLAIGVGFTCVLDGSHSLRCVGSGTLGQLGNGASVTSRTPVTVDLPEGAALAAIAARYSHVCALSTDGRLWCWGANTSGQLGNGTQVNSNLPAEVPPPTRN